jgi:hypothetical protein
MKKTECVFSCSGFAMSVVYGNQSGHSVLAKSWSSEIAQTI